MTEKTVQTLQLPDPKERTPTLLVVDDEALIRMMVSDFLQECGFKVLEASNAHEAIEMIEASQSVIDLVFSDVTMPGELDGFALSRWIRTHRPELPVILTSGDSKKSAAAQAICAKVQFLPKPFDLHLAVAQIRRAIDQQKQSG